MNNSQTSLRITHETIYLFDEEVCIEPHYLRLKPCITPYNKLKSTEIIITPEPVGLSEQRDAENNLVHFCWFEGLHSRLNIRSASIVLLEENNQFDFITFPRGYFELPFSYSDHLTDLLFGALQFSEISKPLMDYGNELREKSTYKTLHFISNLTSQIHDDFTLDSRQTGEPFEANKTFELKKGSCRDLSWMEIQVLRQMGIAARFVSGYYYMGPESITHQLHGWVEVYLPGAGWVGFDPSYGVVAGSSHIPICSSALYQDTMPVTGSYQGNAHSTMITRLSIENMT